MICGQAKSGDICCVRSAVVDGLSRVVESSAPVRDNYVDNGAATKLLVRISVGNRFLIDANAVVVRSPPHRAIAVGVPAVVKSRE